MSINGDHAVGQLVDQLTVGFDSLSSEYRILYDQHRELENKLAWAQQQVSPLSLSFAHFHRLHRRLLHDETT